MSACSTYGYRVIPISPDRALELLAAWPARRDQLRNDRAALVADAWRAGVHNVAQLSRVADVSRDTIYADLRSQSIDPIERSAPMPLPAPTATWHHSHFIRATKAFHGTTYEFTPFTGNETEPTIPPEWECQRADEVGWDAYRARQAEVRAARTLWGLARYRTQMQKMIREALPEWQNYHRAQQTMEAAYAALDSTPDGQWRSAILRLVDARGQAIAAAEKWDRAAAPISELYSKAEVDVQEEAPSLAVLGREIGVDATNWDVRSSYDYRTSWGQIYHPSVNDLEAAIRVQDERIKEVARLAGEHA